MPTKVFEKTASYVSNVVQKSLEKRKRAFWNIISSVAGNDQLTFQLPYKNSLFCFWNNKNQSLLRNRAQNLSISTPVQGRNLRIIWACSHPFSAKYLQGFLEYRISPPISTGLIWVRKAFLKGLSAGGARGGGGGLYVGQRNGKWDNRYSKTEWKSLLEKMKNMYHITRLFAH